jgi:hypothetical protein
MQYGPQIIQVSNQSLDTQDLNPFSKVRWKDWGRGCSAHVRQQQSMDQNFLNNSPSSSYLSSLSTCPHLFCCIFEQKIAIILAVFGRLWDSQGFPYGWSNYHNSQPQIQEPPKTQKFTTIDFYLCSLNLPVQKFHASQATIIILMCSIKWMQLLCYCLFVLLQKMKNLSSQHSCRHCTG